MDMTNNHDTSKGGLHPHDYDRHHHWHHSYDDHGEDGGVGG